MKSYDGAFELEREVCAKLVCRCGADIVQKSCEEEGFCVYGPGGKVGGVDCTSCVGSLVVSVCRESLRTRHAIFMPEC